MDGIAEFFRKTIFYVNPWSENDIPCQLVTSLPLIKQHPYLPTIWNVIDHIKLAATREIISNFASNMHLHESFLHEESTRPGLQNTVDDVQMVSI
jgi:hypothetical protein